MLLKLRYSVREPYITHQGLRIRGQDTSRGHISSNSVSPRTKLWIYRDLLIQVNLKPFFFPLFLLGGKRKGETNNQRRGQKQCLLAQSICCANLKIILGNNSHIRG